MTRTDLTEAADVFCRAWALASGSDSRPALAGAFLQPEAVALGVLIARELTPADSSTLVLLLTSRTADRLKPAQR